MLRMHHLTTHTTTAGSSSISITGEADMEVEEEASRGEGAESRGGEGGKEYEPRKALEMALLDWLPELYKAKSSFGQQKNYLVVDEEEKKEEEEKEDDKCIDIELEDKADSKKVDEDVAMSTDEDNRNKKADDLSSGESSRKKYVENGLYWQELQMICDFFYLPFEHGPTGEKMLNAAKWLVDHFHLVFHPFPDSLQQRFTSGGFYQCNTNSSYSATQQATLPLTSTTAAILGASGACVFSSLCR